MLLKFNTKDLEPLIEHAEKAPRHRTSCSGKNGPALWLVKDEGIYFMSSGEPRLPGGIVYAEGFPPSRGLHLGGDDWVEVFPVKEARNWLNGSEVTIKILEDALEVAVYR